MRQGIQDEFDGPIKSGGCYFLCLCEWAARDAGISLTPQAVKEVYCHAVAQGWMEEDCTIWSAHAGDIYAHVRCDGGAYAITEQRNPPEDDRYIVVLTKPKYTHYVLEYAGSRWDPLDPNRAAAKDYTVSSYRALAAPATRRA